MTDLPSSAPAGSPTTDEFLAAADALKRIEESPRLHNSNEMIVPREDIVRLATFARHAYRSLSALREENERLTKERDEAREYGMGAGECIVMAQERLAAIIFVGRMEKGAAAMFLPEAISNACILVRDEALAYAEAEYRSAVSSPPLDRERSNGA